MPGRSHYQYQKDLDEEVRQEVAKGVQKNGGKLPRILIIGALGRCGRGAIAMAKAAGLGDENLLKWDLEETKTGGPFEGRLLLDNDFRHLAQKPHN